jgi:hypothetical protein
MVINSPIDLTIPQKGNPFPLYDQFGSYNALSKEYTLLRLGSRGFFDRYFVLGKVVLSR